MEIEEIMAKFKEKYHNQLVKQTTELGDFYYIRANYLDIENELDQALTKVREKERERTIKIINEELDEWNSNGEYYANISKAIYHIVKKIDSNN